jgi:D-3-phosphoglycerate dehydrogenase / 2-oxoglutarate reductase
MVKYNCQNPIAPIGLDLFTEEYQKVDSLPEADAVLVRSASMLDTELP